MSHIDLATIFTGMATGGFLAPLAGIGRQLGAAGAHRRAASRPHIVDGRNTSVAALRPNGPAMRWTTAGDGTLVMVWTPAAP
jgi:hypothetical protein